jgi:hypothetical protein
VIIGADSRIIVGPLHRDGQTITPEDRARLEGLIGRYSGSVEIFGSAPCVARWRNRAGQVLEVSAEEGASTAAVLLCQKVAQAHRGELARGH